MTSTDQPVRKRIHVAVGVIHGPDGRILIAQRSAGQHLGGLWEFPGGKVEAGESVTDALARELHEELGITVLSQSALCTIQHDYSDKSVLLDVWNVNHFTGAARGKEGQPLRWLFPHELRHQDFPDANRAIIRSILLPDFVAILNVDATTSIRDEVWQTLPASSFLRLRNNNAGHSGETTYAELIKRLVQQRDSAGTWRPRLMIDFPSHDNIDPSLVPLLGGVHANRHVLQTLTHRPVADDLWFGASCHSAEELAMAAALGADYALLSPVLPTDSHPGQAGMGWDRFQQLTRSSSLAVYAMGGLSQSDLTKAREHGARGIAGIRLFNP